MFGIKFPRRIFFIAAFPLSKEGFTLATELESPVKSKGIQSSNVETNVYEAVCTKEEKEKTNLQK